MSKQCWNEGCPGRSFSRPDHYNYCPDCGRKLSHIAPCKCGRVVEPAWRWCAYCGKPLEQKS